MLCPVEEKEEHACEGVTDTDCCGIAQCIEQAIHCVECHVAIETYSFLQGILNLHQIYLYR